MHEWYRRNGVDDAKKIVAAITVSTRNLPKGLHELNLDNSFIPIKFEVPIMTNLEQAIKISKVNFNKFMALPALLCLSKFARSLNLYPEMLARNIISFFLGNADMTYSNVPWSKEPMYLFNREVYSLGCFAHNQHHVQLFFVGSTYRGKFRVTMMANENLKFNPQELIDIITDKLHSDISQHAKSA